MTQTLNISKGLANQQPYAGAPYNIPVSICVPTKSAPTIATVLIQWPIYNNNGVLADAAAFVNLAGQSASGSIIDSIRSIYIDNTSSVGFNVPVTVYFPDTGFSVTCKANAQGWFPVNTNALQALIIGNGFNTSAFNLNTTVLFANFNMPPYENSQIDTAIARWLASASISRGTTIFNQNFGVPALGDQFGQYNVPLASPGGTATLFGGPQANGFWYLNGYTLIMNNISNSSGTTLLQNYFIESTGAAGTLIQTSYFSRVSDSNPNYVLIPPMMGMNLKLDATQTWRLRSSTQFLSTGTIFLLACFTYNPN